jgi:hypothetical protein
LKKLLILALFLWALPAYSQTTLNGRVQTGNSADKPATCSGGDQFNAIDTFQLFICGPANTWVAQGGGGGTPSSPTNSVQFNNAGAFGGNACYTFLVTTGLLLNCDRVATEPLTHYGEANSAMNETVGFSPYINSPARNEINDLGPGKLVDTTNIPSLLILGQDGPAQALAVNNVTSQNAGNFFTAGAQINGQYNAVATGWNLMGSFNTAHADNGSNLTGDNAGEFGSVIATRNESQVLGGSHADQLTGDQSVTAIGGTGSSVIDQMAYRGINRSVPASGATVTNAYGYRADPYVLNAGTTLLNNYGFYAKDQGQGSTFNAAFYAAAQTANAHNWGVYSDAANIDHLGSVTLGTLSASGQITSTVATGTAPFVVASTTPVANLTLSALSQLPSTVVNAASPGAGVAHFAGATQTVTSSAVVSSDLNITTSTCTNQFLTAISATGTGTCTTDTLASAQHANQGTTTTVLHGNAAGNPSFSAVAPGDVSLTSAHLLVGNVSNVAADVGLSGDSTLANTGAITNTKINGTSVPTNSAADQFLGTTASATGAWASIANCTDTGGNHLNYTTSTHLFSCGTSSSGGAVTFSAITGSTNTTAAMIVGTGASLASVPEVDIGAAGTNGVLGLKGTTSGTATITAPAIAGTTTNPIVSTNAIAGPGSNACATPTFTFSNDTNSGIASGPVNTGLTLCAAATAYLNMLSNIFQPAFDNNFAFGDSTHRLSKLFVAGAITGNDRNSIANFNQAAQSQVVVSATEYYITHSDLDMPAAYTTAIAAGTTMHWRIALTKTAAGTGTFQILLKKGTNGSTADTSIVTQTIGTQTAAADNMEADISLTWTSATAAYWTIIPHQAASTGTGFGLVYPAAAAQFSGTISGQTTTTVSDKYGLSVIFTTGTPTFVVNMVQAQAFGVN